MNGSRAHASTMVIITLAISLLFVPNSTITSNPLIQNQDAQDGPYVFAGNEGLIRCSDGKLVNSEDQCPSTDVCPPPQIESVANCVSESSSQTNESSSRTNEGNNNETIRNPCSEERRLTPLSRCTNSSFSSENNATVAGKKRQEIAISTNKDNYEQGEAITMTVKNGGKQSLVFSMENSDFVIRNLKTGQTYKPSAVLGTLLIAPGATKEFFWNQQDDNNTQAISGNYSASVSIDSTKANTSFTVSQ